MFWGEYFKMAKEVSRLNGKWPKKTRKDALNKVRFACGVLVVSLSISAIQSCMFLDKAWVELHFRGIFKDKITAFD